MKILFLDGTKGFSPDRLTKKPTGGILTSLTKVPRYLASKGHDVSVLSDYPNLAFQDGVTYLPAPIERNDFDVVVMNRNMVNALIVNFFKDSLKVWWLHDIPDHRYLEDGSFAAVDKIVALSRYNRDSFSDFYDIPQEKFEIIGNGVDRSVFCPGTEKRNHNLFVCASAPIKGLYPVEFMFQNLRRLSPSFELRLYCNQNLHDLSNTPQMDTTLSRLRSLGVKVLDPIPQKELADVFRKARALIMPGHYPENDSNTLKQALACGLPVVGSPIGSIPEFVQDGVNGLLTKTTPSDFYWWWKDFAKQCATIWHDDNLAEKLSAGGPVSVQTWDEVGEQWDRLLTLETLKRKVVA